MDPPRPSAGSRIWAYTFSLALIAAVLFPVIGDPRDDDFPLSTYPMFSGRASSEASISHAVGILDDGSEVNLPPESFANDEVIRLTRPPARLSPRVPPSQRTVSAMRPPPGLATSAPTSSLSSSAPTTSTR